MMIHKLKVTINSRERDAFEAAKFRPSDSISGTIIRLALERLGEIPKTQAIAAHPIADTERNTASSELDVGKAKMAAFLARQKTG